MDYFHKQYQALMISLLLAQTSSWTNIKLAGDLSYHDNHVISPLWSAADVLEPVYS